MSNNSISPEKRLEWMSIYIKELRFNMGMTQQDLAEKSDLPRSTIQRAEGANNINIETLFIIADALRVNPSELIDVE